MDEFWRIVRQDWNQAERRATGIHELHLKRELVDPRESTVLARVTIDFTPVPGKERQYYIDSMEITLHDGCDEEEFWWLAYRLLLDTTLTHILIQMKDRLKAVVSQDEHKLVYITNPDSQRLSIET